MKLNDMQKKLIKQGLAMQLQALAQQQKDAIDQAIYDQDMTDRIYTVKTLHHINDQMKAIKGVNDQLEIKNFFSSFDFEIEEQLQIFRDKIGALKAEYLPNK